MADLTPDLEAQIAAAEQAAKGQQQQAPTAQPDAAPAQPAAPGASLPDHVLSSDIEQQIKQAEAARQSGGVAPPPAAPSMAERGFQLPGKADIDASVSRFQRMEDFKAEVERIAANLKPAEPRPAALDEKLFAPLAAVGSSIGTAIRRPLLDTKDPQTQAVLGARPGVPFEANPTTNAVSFMDRLALQFTFNKAEAAYSLMAANPSVQDVHFNQLGDPVVTIKDKQTGEVKDILANPVGIDKGDFAFVLANAPQLLAGGYAGAVRKGVAETMLAPDVMRDLSAASRFARNFLYNRGVTATSGRMALFGEGAGAGADLLARGTMAQQGELPAGTQPVEDLERRGVNAMADFLFGHLTGAGANVASRVVSPLSARGPIQINAENAARLWEKEGVTYTPTLGERTGNTFFLRSEAYSRQKPGSAGVFAKFDAKQLDALNQMQRIMIGVEPSVVQPADLVGHNVLTSLEGHLNPLDQVIDRTSSAVLDSVDQEIKQNIKAATGIPDNVSQAAVGQTLFKGASARLDTFEASRRSLYDVVKKDPRVLAQGRNIDASPLAEQAQGILDSVASVEKDAQVPTVDAYGSPTTKSVTKTEPLTSVLEPNSMSVLKQLANAKGGRIGYADLIEARHDIGRALDGARLLGGIPEKRMEGIYATLTGAIKNGLDSLDDTGGLRQAWEKANDFTAQGMEQFKQVDILPMFKEGTQRGALDLYDIVGRAIKDQGRWMAYRDFFGATSPEMGQLRRAYADSLVGRTIGSDTIDTGAFASRLAEAYKNQPDIVADAFGNRTQQLKALADAGAGIKSGNVAVADLADALQKGSLTKGLLRDLQSAQAEREALNRNSLIADIRKGNFQADPAKLVDNFVFSAKTDPSDLREVLALLSPDDREMMVQRTVLRILQESTAGPPSKERIRSALISRFTTDSTDGNMIGTRVRDVLGDDRFRLLKATQDLTAPSDGGNAAFKSAGGISGGMAISQLERQFMGPGMVGALKGIVKSAIMATTYKSGAVQGYLANNLIGTADSAVDRAAFVNGFMSAAPTLQNLTSLLGQTEAARSGRILSLQLKNAIDSDLRQGTTQQKQQAPAQAKPAGR